MLRGDIPEEIYTADEAASEAIADQIELAKAAFDSAEEQGKHRLQTVLQVLREYRTLARMSRDPDMVGLAQRAASSEGTTRDECLSEIAAAAWRAGLPREIYGPVG